MYSISNWCGLIVCIAFRILPITAHTGKSKLSLSMGPFIMQLVSLVSMLQKDFYAWVASHGGDFWWRDVPYAYIFGWINHKSSITICDISLPVPLRAADVPHVTRCWSSWSLAISASLKLLCSASETQQAKFSSPKGPNYETTFSVRVKMSVRGWFDVKDWTAVLYMCMPKSIFLELAGTQCAQFFYLSIIKC